MLQDEWEQGKGYEHDTLYYRNLDSIADSDMAFGLKGEGQHPSIIALKYEKERKVNVNTRDLNFSIEIGIRLS